MHVVVVEFTIEPAHIDDFRRRVRQQAQDSLQREADCHQFDICIDPRHQDRLLLYETYSDAEAFDAHLRSPHFTEFDAAVRAWIRDKKVSRYEKI